MAGVEAGADIWAVFKALQEGVKVGDAVGGEVFDGEMGGGAGEHLGEFAGDLVVSIEEFWSDGADVGVRVVGGVCDECGDAQGDGGLGIKGEVLEGLVEG